MLVDDDPAHEAHEQYKEWFGSDEVLSVAIPVRNALSPDTVRLQSALVERLESVEGVNQVSALVTQEDPVGAGDELVVRSLFPPGEFDRLAVDSYRAAMRDRILSHPIWPGWLTSESLGAVALQLRLDDSVAGEAARDQTIQEIEDGLRAVLGGRAYHLAGHPFMKREISSSIARDLARLLPVSFAAMIILIVALTRSLYIGICTSVSILASAIWMLGGMGWLGLGVTALSNTAPTILLALATACFLHLTAAFQASSEPDSRCRSQAAIEQVRRPMWIACGTTAAGYASLSISSVPIVREFGIALGIGMLSVGFVGTLLLPALLALAPRSAQASGFARGLGLSRFLAACARLVGNRAPAVLVCSAGLAVVMAMFASQIDVDSSGPRRFHEDSNFRVASRFYRAQLSGDVLESIYLRGEPGAFLDPDVLRSIQALESAAESLPEVEKAISFVDIVARTYWVFRGEVGDPRLIPETREAVAQLMLLYEASGDVGDLFDYVSSDYSRVRLFLTADVQSSSISRQLKADLESLAGTLLPGFVEEHSVVSTEMLLSRAADAIAVEQVKSAGVAVLLVVVLVGIGFRSVAVAGLMLFPNLLPILVNLGLMAVVGIPLSDATSIISATAIGMAVDSTVHLIATTRASERQFGIRRAAVFHAILTTGRPVAATSFVVVVGFSLLMLSEFGSVAELGALTGLTMVYCALADFLVLPAQLLLRAKDPDGFESRVISHESGARAAVLRTYSVDSKPSRRA